MSEYTPPGIHKKLWTESRGFAISVVDGWMARKWTKGVHYHVIGRQTIINVKEADAWLIINTRALCRSTPAAWICRSMRVRNQ